MKSTNENVLKHMKLSTMLMSVALFFGAEANAELLIDHALSVSLDTQYHSNLQYLPQNAESTYIYRLLPTYKIIAQDGKNDITGMIGFNFQKSSNSRISNDREDPTAKFAWIRTLESSELAFNAYYSKQSSRVAQLAQNGLVTADGSSVEKEYSLGWTNYLTSRLTLDLLGSYQDNVFTGVNTLGNFDQRNALAELSYKYDGRFTPFVRLTAHDFRGQSREEYQSALLGSEMFLFPKLTLKAAAGVTHFSSDGDNQAVGFLEADYEGARYTSTLTLSRRAFPTALNFIEIGDTLQLEHNYQLSSKGTLGGRLTAIQNKQSDFKTQAFSVLYNHEITSQWIFGAKLGYRNIKVGPQNSTNDNTLAITVTYNSLKF